MTLEDIQARVAAIELVKLDDEIAHTKEDALMVDFIRWVAECDEVSEQVRKLALEVLKTGEIDFSRWCA